MPRTNWSDAQYLRELAEASVRRLSRRRFSDLPPVRLQHEIEVHVTELEMQNEALRETQRELEASRAEYRDLFELAPVAYVAVGRDGGIHAANAAAVELLGMARDDIVGVRFARFVSDSEAEAFERHQREVIGSTDRIRAEFTVTGRDGTPRRVRFESQCVNAVLGEWRVALIDVTKTNSLERQLEQTERLGVIGTNTSGVVHDFKNILGSIVTSAEIALRKLGPDHEARRPLERLKLTALRGGNVVTQLLSFTRNHGSETGYVDLNAFIPVLEPVLRAQLGTAIDLKLDLAAADAWVRVDSGQVEQILLNLTTNAHHAMSEGGRLTIATANVDVVSTGAKTSKLTEGLYVVLRVSDTGIGMDEKTRTRAFEPFFTTKPSTTGSGLGLPLVLAVALRSGGFAELDSEPGRGTTVSVYLPRASGSLRTPSERPPVRESLPAELVVVVVADNPEERRAARDYFRTTGCEAFDAGTGVEALEILREHRRQLVVLLIDDHLPDRAQVEFARTARDVVPTLRISVVPLAGTRSAIDEETGDPAARARLGALYDAVVRALASSVEPPQ